MTKDERFERAIEYLVSLNPNDEQLTEAKFYALAAAIYRGEELATENLRQLIFYRACEWVLKDYIEEDRDFDEFEDDVMEAYLFSKETSLPPFNEYKKFKKTLDERIENFFVKHREVKKEKNVYLNYDWQNLSHEIIDEKAERQIYDYSSTEEIARMIKEFNESHPSISEEKKQMAIDATGIFTGSVDFKTVAKKYKTTRQKVATTTSKYLMLLRKECFGSKKTKTGKELLRLRDDK